MANKKLGTTASELRLPTKKSKGDKKPKWQAKIGKGKAKAEEMPATEPTEQAGETPVVAVEEPASVVEHPVEVATPETTQESHVPEPTLEPTPTIEPTSEQAAEEPTPAIDDEPATKKPNKLKVKADFKSKKLSLIAAALQVLQERKVAMTCPELIDVMATEALWVSPGGKTPASTLYAAIGRSIKDLGRSSPFKKSERGKFEAKILPTE